MVQPPFAGDRKPGKDDQKTSAVRTARILSNRPVNAAMITADSTPIATAYSTDTTPQRAPMKDGTEERGDTAEILKSQKSRG